MSQYIKQEDGTWIKVGGMEKPIDQYSTNEIVVGRWIDGKKIYRKCYSTTMKNGVNVIDKIEDMDTYLGCRGSYLAPDYEKHSIPWVGSNSEYTNILVDTIGYVRSTSNVTGTSCMIIIEYTKTTES